MSVVAWLLPGLDAVTSVHPLLVHMPLALFPTALAFAGLAIWRRSTFGPAGRVLVVLGTGSMVLALISGFKAQTFVPHGPGSLVVDHRTLMLVGFGLAVLASLLALRCPPTTRGQKLLMTALVPLNVVLLLGADRGALVAVRSRAGMALLPPVPTSVGDDSRPPEEGDPGRGGSLYERLACGTCHDPGRDEEAPGIPPSLTAAGSRLRRKWVSGYLLAPHRRRWLDGGIRPTVRMPDYRLNLEDATDLAAFLATRVDSVQFPSRPVVDPPLTRQEAERGRTLFRQYACLGCHFIGDQGNPVGPALDAVGSRLEPAYVFAFLSAPDQIIPGTSMKDFELWSDEARSLTAYLMTLRETDAR